MSTIINTRSPFYKKITNASLATAKLECYISQGTYAQRTGNEKNSTLKKTQERTKQKDRD